MVEKVRKDILGRIARLLPAPNRNRFAAVRDDVQIRSMKRNEIITFAYHINSFSDYLNSIEPGIAVRAEISPTRGAHAN